MPVDIKDYPYVVSIQWKTYINWNELCAQCVEYFGLPGGKYTTNPTTEYMDFCFKDEVDAIWFRLKCE
jgi:hypothetical protein